MLSDAVTLCFYMGGGVFAAICTAVSQTRILGTQASCLRVKPGLLVHRRVMLSVCCLVGGGGAQKAHAIIKLSPSPCGQWLNGRFTGNLLPTPP